MIIIIVFSAIILAWFFIEITLFLENKKYYHLINPITFTPSGWSKILKEEIVRLEKKTKVINFLVEKIPDYIFSKIIWGS